MVSKRHLSKTVKRTHILHAKSYPRFSSVSHVRLISVLFTKFVNPADFVGHNGVSNIFFQLLQSLYLDDNIENVI